MSENKMTDSEIEKAIKARELEKFMNRRSATLMQEAQEIYEYMHSKGLTRGDMNVIVEFLKLSLQCDNWF